MELLLLGRPLGAQRAYQVGLVNRLVPTVGEVLPAAMELAARICRNGPLAVKTAKEIAMRCCGEEPGFVLENALFQRVRQSEDAQEGPRAYMERRKPRFVGR
jgi:enoyl-CoA hydratase